MKQNDLDYIAATIDKAVKSNITVLLPSKKFSRENGESSAIAGYFSDDDRELLCCTKAPFKHWFGTFVHESSHMDQFLENSKAWRRLERKGPGTLDACDMFFAWLEGDKLESDTLKWATERTRDMELDCEKRTVQKIKDWGLSLDIEDYIRSANSYVLFYNFVRKHRVWTRPGKGVYRSPKIRNLIPATFDINYSILPKWYEDAVIDHCFDGDIKSAKIKARKVRKKNQEEGLDGQFAKRIRRSIKSSL